MSSHPNTRLKITDLLCSQFREAGSLVILSGDSGSGRTGALENVIAELEDRYQIIFVPCSADESLPALRQMFLSQLLPGGKWDVNLKLCDTLNRIPVPGRRKVLVMVDDIDAVTIGFFNELKSLYEQTLGGGRFAFLLTAHPLWTQQVQRVALVTSKGKFREIAMLPLSLQESLSLVKAYFEAAGRNRDYEAISQKLPRYLEGCKGNISKVIKQTELLMDDPKLAQSARPPENEAQLRALKKKKNRGLAGIFITVVSLIIVILCIIPLFTGGSLFGGDEKNEEGTDASTVIRPGASSLPSFSSGNRDDYQKGQEDSAEKAEQAKSNLPDVSVDEALKAEQRSSDPLRSSAPAPTDLKAQQEHGSADKPQLDDGALLPDLKEGIEANTPDAEHKKSVTLNGETLDAIEKSEAGSGKDPELPRRSLDGSLKKNDVEGKVQSAGSGDFLTRGDNMLRQDAIKAEDEALRIQSEAEALKQLQNTKAAEEEAKLKVLADKAAASLDEGEKKSIQAQKRNASAKRNSKPRANRSASYSGPERGGIPGSVSELWNKNADHYTLQVIAGRNRQAVVQASAGVSDRYWIYETTRERRPWYVLVTGDFASPNAAVRERAKLPSSLRVGGPFPKTFDRVQTEMRLSTANGR